MKSLVAKSLLVVGLAAGLMVGGCDQKSGSGTGGGTTAPSGSTGSNSGAGGGGAKSLPGNVVETTKDVVNRANEAGAKVGEAAEQVGDTAMGAWADLRSKAASEGEKRLEGFKKKIQELQTTNPALFTSLNEAAKMAETKIADLKKAGADAWKSLSEDLKGKLDAIEKQLGA